MSLITVTYVVGTNSQHKDILIQMITRLQPYIL